VLSNIAMKTRVSKKKMRIAGEMSHQHLMIFKITWLDYPRKEIAEQGLQLKAYLPD